MERLNTLNFERFITLEITLSVLKSISKFEITLTCTKSFIDLFCLIWCVYINVIFIHASFYNTSINPILSSSILEPVLPSYYWYLLRRLKIYILTFFCKMLKKVFKLSLKSNTTNNFIGFTQTVNIVYINLDNEKNCNL